MATVNDQHVKPLQRGADLASPYCNIMDPIYLGPIKDPSGPELDETLKFSRDTDRSTLSFPASSP
jgi:hypothetical protein